MVPSYWLVAGWPPKLPVTRPARGRPVTLDRLTTEDLPAPDRDADPTADDIVATAEPDTGHPTPSGPPSAWARNVVIGVLVGFVVASYAGNLFLSVLVTDRPLVFISLNAQNRNLALASGELTAISFYVVGFLRLFAPDPFFFLLGRWYGDAAIRWMERRAPSYGALLRSLEKGFHRSRILVVAFAPNNPVCLFAGASGMSWGVFALANAIGTVIRLVLIRAFASVFEGPLGSLRVFIGDYRWPILGVSFVLVALTMWSDRKAGRESIGDLVTMDEDIHAAEDVVTDGNT